MDLHDLTDSWLFQFAMSLSNLQTMPEKGPARRRRFGDSFIPIRPEVLYLKDEDLAEDLYEFASGIRNPLDPTNSSASALSMIEINILPFAVLDGGLAFVENGWGDEGALEEAFSRWVDEKTAAGEEWDEDDFEYQPFANIEGPPLASGSSIIGRDAIRACLAWLAFDPSSLPEGLTPDPDLLSQAQQGATSGNGPEEQQELIRRELPGCHWDHLIATLKNARK